MIDTNVLIASFIAKGACHTLVEYCLKTHICLTSSGILNELDDKLIHRFKCSQEDAAQVNSLLCSKVNIVVPSVLDVQICRDPDDDLVLATAFAGDADCIITGDKDLLILQQVRGVDIMKPADFLDYENTFTG
ncbi:MAG: putative toxin-antitoxin system toxin component, PIN family [Cyanobacteria bacterium P01_E01_bin.6]